MLADPTIKFIIVEYRERLARFGFGFGFDDIEMSLASAERKLIVVDEQGIDDDLVQDMVDILTSFCTRLYGRRGAKHRAHKAVTAAADADP